MARPGAHGDLETTEIWSAQRGGLYKGESAIHLARVSSERKRNFEEHSFWGGVGTLSPLLGGTKR